MTIPNDTIWSKEARELVQQMYHLPSIEKMSSDERTKFLGLLWLIQDYREMHGMKLGREAFKEQIANMV
jgi:hypothetical protein